MKETASIIIHIFESACIMEQEKTTCIGIARLDGKPRSLAMDSK